MKSRSGPCLLGFLLLAGCSQRMGEISGHVTFEGARLPYGRITFHTQGENRTSLISEIKDGAYTVTKCPLGEVIVTVETFERHQATDIPEGLGKGFEARFKGASTGKFVPIPARYGDTTKSGLKCTVTPDAQQKDFDLIP